MAIKKDEALKFRQPVGVDDVRSTGVLDGTTTTETMNLSMAASKISYQRTDTLQCTVEVSLNGVDFESATAVTTAALTSYSTHNIKAVRVTRTSGSGRLVVAAK